MNNYQEYLTVLEKITKLKGLEAEVYNAIGFLGSPIYCENNMRKKDKVEKKALASPPKTIPEICDEIERQREYHEVYTEGGTTEPLWLSLLPKEFRRWLFERKVSAIVDRLTHPETDRLRRLDDGRLVRSYADWPQREQTS